MEQVQMGQVTEFRMKSRSPPEKKGGLRVYKIQFIMGWVYKGHTISANLAIPNLSDKPGHDTTKFHENGVIP